MKITEGFRLRTILGESVVVGEGVKQVNFDKIISLNETAALLWKSVEDKEFTTDDLVNLLLENYEIDRETALSDVEAMTNKWKELGLVC